MRLRDHPLMTYHGVSNWPPVWIQTSEQRRVIPEMGILKHVHCFENEPCKTYLIIDHKNQVFVGRLLFSDPSFWDRVTRLLKQKIGWPIKELGELNISERPTVCD